MEPLGDYLKRERELREITLSEIATETKIKQKLLEAIEEEDFCSLPAPAFVKGFLRAYSRYVGLDGNDVVLRYEDLLERLKDGKKKEGVEEEEKITAQPRYRLTIFIPILGFIFLLIYTLWIFYFRKS